MSEVGSQDSGLYSDMMEEPMQQRLLSEVDQNLKSVMEVDRGESQNGTSQTGDSHKNQESPLIFADKNDTFISQVDPSQENFDSPMSESDPNSEMVADLNSIVGADGEPLAECPEFLTSSNAQTKTEESQSADLGNPLEIPSSDIPLKTEIDNKCLSPDLSDKSTLPPPEDGNKHMPRRPRHSRRSRKFSEDEDYWDKEPLIPELQEGYRILKELMSTACKTSNWPFLNEIKAEEVPDYHEKIKTPMWLGKSKIINYSILILLG